MERTLAPTFRSPTVTERLKSMLGVDFYRLFHTPLFYALEGLLCLNLTLCSILRFPRARGAFDELKRGVARLWAGMFAKS